MLCVKLMDSTLFEAAKKRKVNYYGILVVGTIYILNKKFFSIHTEGWVQYFCKCYLNDMICPLLILGVSQIMLIWAGYEIKCFRHYISMGVLTGIIWEYFAPIINPKSVTDVLDIVCYMLGTFLYYILWKYETNRSCWDNT